MKKLIAKLLNKPVCKLYTWICVTLCPFKQVSNPYQTEIYEARTKTKHN